jgi:hypothetical protein
MSTSPKYISDQSLFCIYNNDCEYSDSKEHDDMVNKEWGHVEERRGMEICVSFSKNTQDKSALRLIMIMMLIKELQEVNEKSCGRSFSQCNYTK